MEAFDLYRDIEKRTDGDVYIGVVGPVRTGKSTFITRFMEKLVLPGIESAHKRKRAQDELPQSGSGKTIMTTQLAFVPGEAVNIRLDGDTQVRVRLVDCVGYLVPGALGTQEDDAPRMVRTPWQDAPMPFEEAAEQGTRRVVREHSTIAVVVTTDGTIGDLARSAYVEAEERVISELKSLGKPFVIVLNSADVQSDEAKRLQNTLKTRYNVPVALVDVLHMEMDDIQSVLEMALYQFPMREIEIRTPAWLEALEDDHWLIRHLREGIAQAAQSGMRMGDQDAFTHALDDSPYASGMRRVETQLGEGRAVMELPLKEGLFNRILGEECGTPIRSDAHLLSMLKELVSAKREYDHVAQALRDVRETGYGLVSPRTEEMTLEEPEIVRQGGNFGVKLKAHAPSLHLIRVDIETEVSPVVGTQSQSEELLAYLLSEFEQDKTKIWNTNLFGKSLNELVREGLSGKLMKMPDDAREKVAQTLGKIINEGNGGMICILL